MSATELSSLANTILASPKPAWEKDIREQIMRMGQLFNNAGDNTISWSNPADGESTTANGLAVSPRWAEMCLDDFARTACFLRGVYAAIGLQKTAITNRPVRVFYAGCGPFGTLCTPLMAIESAERVQFTLLDIHQVSLDSVASLIGNLGLVSHVAGYIADDAINIKFDDTNQPDVIVMEIMQSALDKEPQVAVARHLMRQAPDAIMVPQDISVDLALVNTEREFAFQHHFGLHNRDRIEVGNVFRLNQQTIKQWDGLTGDTLPANSVSLPDYDGSIYQPMLMTRIIISPGNCLYDHDSGLTIPRMHPSLAGSRPLSRLQFNYKTGRQPGLVAKIV